MSFQHYGGVSFQLLPEHILVLAYTTNRFLHLFFVLIVTEPCNTHFQGETGMPGNFVGAHQGCQVPFRPPILNVGLLLRRCSGKGLHLAMTGEPRGFVELRRDSRVMTGNSGCLLCWPREYWSFSFSISPSNDYSGLISIRVWSCCPRESQESSATPQFKSINSLVFSFLYGPTLTSVPDYLEKP